MNKECKLAFAYLYEKRAEACLLALAVAFLFLITELYHAPREMAVYTSLMLGTGAALAFAVGLYRYRAVHNALQVLLRQSAVALEEMPAPRGLLDRDWQALVRAVDAARRDAVERSETARRDAQEYYTLWAHQVKTPLAAMQLLAQEEEFPAQGLFLSELFQTQQYVDMVMSYQRMASMMKDLCVQKVDVDAAVQAAAEAVREEHAAISARVSPLIARKTQEYMQFMTDGAYTEVQLDTALNARCAGEDGLLLDGLRLSAGTRDQLYLALRLAACEVLQDGGEPVPLILDDPFVTFDDQRTARAMALLRQLAAGRQVIVLTCRTVGRKEGV